MKREYLIGIILFIVLMLWIGSDLFKAFDTKTTEGFASQSSSITLNMCPIWAPQVQTAKGNTDCCEGNLVDGKCSTRTFCTLSPAHDNVQTCINAWKQYYANKSKQCPSTMPNYFEDVKVRGGQKGCSVSNTKEDGSLPVNPAAARCKIYDNEKDNREKTDSCFVEKGRLAVKCPPFAGYTSRVENVLDNGKFGSYVCSYSNPLGQRNSCNDEKSLIAMWDRQNPNWRITSGRYAQLEQLSCRTFLDRERKKEEERKRIEAEKRRADEERRKREEAERKYSKLSGFFARFKRQAQQAAERARRLAEEQRRAAQRRVDELSRRLRGCK